MKKRSVATIRAVLSELCHERGIRATAEAQGVSAQTVLAWLAQMGERAPLSGTEQPPAIER